MPGQGVWVLRCPSRICRISFDHTSLEYLLGFLGSEKQSRIRSAMSLAEKYVRGGHPTIEELIAEQRVSFPRDPRELLGDFWPEEESIDDFLAALREWRGRTKTDPAA